jgi:hypothetical protein
VSFLLDTLLWVGTWDEGFAHQSMKMNSYMARLRHYGSAFTEARLNSILGQKSLELSCCTYFTGPNCLTTIPKSAASSNERIASHLDEKGIFQRLFWSTLSKSTSRPLNAPCLQNRTSETKWAERPEFNLRKVVWTPNALKSLESVQGPL